MGSSLSLQCSEGGLDNTSKGLLQDMRVDYTANLTEAHHNCLSNHKLGQKFPVTESMPTDIPHMKEVRPTLSLPFKKSGEDSVHSGHCGLCVQDTILWSFNCPEDIRPYDQIRPLIYTKTQISSALPSGVTGAVATLVTSGLVPRHYTTQGDFTTAKLTMMKA